MVSVIGIDTRSFSRTTFKRRGGFGNFSSIIGIAVKVRDYSKFDDHYRKSISVAFEGIGEEIDYTYYCYNDIKDHKNKYDILDTFTKEISENVDKVHVFYSLFSQKTIPEIKVYGRMAKERKLKLGNPTRTLNEFLSEHLTNTFPAICAWRIMDYFTPETIEFHLDSYSGHIFEAQEDLDNSDFSMVVIPSGDCTNPVISTADLLLETMDHRLEKQGKRLLFSNIRPALPEFGESVLVYPITNKHLPKITPIDKKPIKITQNIKHPVYWFFKGDPLIDSGTLKRSKTYRNLIDYVACKGGTVKMFDKGKDIEHFKNGDFAVYLNEQGKSVIESYQKIGKRFKMFNLDLMVPREYKSQE